MEIYVATSNAGKLREMRELFTGAPFDLRTFEEYRSPIEGEKSYADNAALKARALHRQLARAGRVAAVLADDSGLEVEALGGRPGVLTAFYGGPDLSWSERRRRLLQELAASDVAERGRRARFVCALHFIDAAGRELGTMATVDGAIATEERGELGFSFDPIFVYGPNGRTFAELLPEEKNRVSHRAIAAAGLIAEIERAALIDAPR